MFLFVSNLELTADMMQNTKVHYHANQVIKTLEKIVILFTKSLISEQDKEKLVELGKRHYHVGLKKEHFKVLKSCFFSFLNKFKIYMHKKVFENCFIKSLEESLNVSVFHEKFENPWRKLIQYIFKQYTDGMNFEEKEEIKFADRILDIYTS